MRKVSELFRKKRIWENKNDVTGLGCKCGMRESIVWFENMRGGKGEVKRG